MPVQMKFKDDGTHVHCYVSYEGPLGKMVACGTANKEPIQRAIQKLIQANGPAKVASVMGCSCSAPAISGEINTMASEQALRKVAAMMGFSPFNLVKSAFNASRELAPHRLLRRALSVEPTSLLSRGRRGGNAPSPQALPPDDSQQSTDDSTFAESDASNTKEDATMGDFEIGFLPLALAAFQQRKKLAAIAKSANPRAANAAKVLAKAKGGDPAAKKKIAVINKAAKAGDPTAKDAMKRLHTVNNATKVSPSNRPTLSNLYRAGISR